MSPDAPAFGVAPQRTPVEFDAATGGLRIGPYERRVENPAEPGQVYSAYLSLLYAVRGAKPGDRLALREADLEALLLIVGDDPGTIEQRLVGLMGCTPEEASALGRLLLRHRKATATLGIAAGLSLGAAGLVSWAADGQPAPTEVVQSASAAPAEAPEPISGTTQVAAPAPVVGPVAPAPVQVGPVATSVQPTTTAVVVAAPQPAAPEPAAPEPAAPEPPAPGVVAPEPAAPEPAPVAAAPAVPAPVPPQVAAPAPVEVEVVAEDPAYALPTYSVPILDAPPPPVEVELPDSDIGEPAVLEGPVEQIGGVVDSDDDLPEVVPAPDVVEPPLAAEEPLEEPPVEELPLHQPVAVEVAPPAPAEPISGVAGG